uniref:Transcription elongation factor SPT4 n=1 Tax=Cacopsylla melanoneura TaxID=428564 RepID=A0A8D9ERR8_9HEMI
MIGYLHFILKLYSDRLGHFLQQKWYLLSKLFFLKLNDKLSLYFCFRMIALMDPKDSWVAKWQRINRFVPGVYAISVAGRLPHSAITEMQRRGIVYKQRDLADRR